MTYSYDANGNRTSMSDATGMSSYGYDPFGELTSDQNGAAQTVGYEYNADGQVTGITYPLPASATWASASKVGYTYDNADLLTKVTDFNGNPITITSTADGLGSSAGLGSTGDTVTTAYDGTDTPSSIALQNGSTTLQSFAYANSPSGAILSETDTPSSTQATYTYDAGGRVTSMTVGTGNPVNYIYDPSGNLTTLPTGAATGYDNASELTSSTLNGTTTSYAYDAAGQRLTAKQGTTTVTSATWNGAGQLTSYTSPSASMTAATYDGDGLRATTTTGGQAQAFTWGTLAGNPDLIMDSANAYIYATGTAPAEQVNLATGAVTYLVADSLGSVRGVVSSSGSLTGTASYDAWGNPLSPGGLTATTPFGYAGGYTDPTGLIYLTNRYYDPATGQFTSLDPQVSQTLQPFSYAGDNPVSGTDPTGLAPGPPPGGGNCGPNDIPSCRYTDAISWTQNQMWNVVYGHGNFHSIFAGIQSDWGGLSCIDPWEAPLCAEALSDWKGMVHAGARGILRSPWDKGSSLRIKPTLSPTNGRTTRGRTSTRRFTTTSGATSSMGSLARRKDSRPGSWKACR